MGCLEELATGRRITLGQEFLIGRSPGSALVLDDRCVSSQHALLRWRRGRWSVRDLGSRNGTTVDERALQPGRDEALSPGSLLGFGGTTQRWRLIDEGPPTVAARQQGGDKRVVGEHGFMALPDSEQPLLTVYRDADGQWLAEHEGELRRVADQDLLEVAGARWQLWIPQHGAAVDSTRSPGPPRTLQRMTARFQVSRDEEYIELDLQAEDGLVALGARSHHYMLLLLARRRQADRDNPDLGVTEEGWLYTDELCDMLGCDAKHLNIQVFRVRQQLAQAGIDNAAEIIERRPSTRSLRLGLDRLVFETV